MNPPAEFSHAIAVRELELGLPDGSEVVYLVRLKEPSLMADGDWECTYEIKAPEEAKRTSVIGADAVQALTTALRVIAAELKTLARTRGGRFTWLGQDELGFVDSPVDG